MLLPVTTKRLAKESPSALTTESDTASSGQSPKSWTHAGLRVMAAFLKELNACSRRNGFLCVPVSA